MQQVNKFTCTLSSNRIVCTVLAGGGRVQVVFPYGAANHTMSILDGSELELKQLIYAFAAEYNNHDYEALVTTPQYSAEQISKYITFITIVATHVMSCLNAIIGNQDMYAYARWLMAHPSGSDYSRRIQWIVCSFVDKFNEGPTYAPLAWTPPRLDVQ